MSNIIRSRKVTQIIPLNSEKVARSQPRIIEFLSDNANKDNTWLCAPSSPDAEETSNLSPQVAKVPLLKESVSEAEGTAKMVWSVVKPNTTPSSPVEPQNPSNFAEVACKSKVKRGEKSNKALTAPKLSLHNLECWKINLHRCKAASYNMCEVTKNIRFGLVLAQEPWTYANKIRSKLRGWNLFQGIEKGNRPRACIYATTDLCCSLIPMFSNEDIVAVRVNNVCQSGDSFVFVSAYMAAEEPAPSNLLRDLLAFAENEQIPTIVGTDANAHHTIWGSSDINPPEEDLLAYCASADLNFCNVCNKPTFRTKTLEEVLDLTLVNRCAWDRVVGWHVSDVPSFSDHMYIRFQVKSRIQKQAKMFRNVRRMCWNKYANELGQKLNERILRPVPVPSSKEDIDVLANKVHSVITKSYEAACPMRKSLRKKITFGEILS